jgi:hypothetical protein
MELFHGTNARFEQFSLDNAARPGMAANGFLGVWLAVNRELAECYGSYCLVVTADIGRAYRMPISELSRLHSDCRRSVDDIECPQAARAAECRFYTRVREELLRRGFDAIEVVENDGQVEMVIGLEPARLSIQ